MAERNLAKVGVASCASLPAPFFFNKLMICNFCQWIPVETDREIL